MKNIMEKRYKEIQEMAEAHASHMTSDKDMQVAFADALRRGAEWADEHPHWISVEDYSTDELPPLIDKNNLYGESVQVLFVVILDGIQYVNKGAFDYDTGVWHSLDMQCSFCKENVTHWMPLPQAPKKGD